MRGECRGGSSRCRIASRWGNILYETWRAVGSCGDYRGNLVRGGEGACGDWQQLAQEEVTSRTGIDWRVVTSAASRAMVWASDFSEFVPRGDRN